MQETSIAVMVDPPEKSVILKALAELNKELDILLETINVELSKSIGHFITQELPENPIEGAVDKKQESKVKDSIDCAHGKVRRAIRDISSLEKRIQ